jgi:hypothetical protein
VQVVVAVDISPLVLTHLEQAVATVEMVAVAVEPQRHLEQAVRAVMAYFISTTKRGKQWQHMQ